MMGLEKSPKFVPRPTLRSPGVDGSQRGMCTIGRGEGGPSIAYMYSPLTPVALPPMLVQGTEA